MIGYSSMCDYYGVVPMSVTEEASAPEPVRQTRGNKIRMIDDCAAILRCVNDYGNRARIIPEENDAEHAKRVADLAGKIHAARTALEMCWR